MKTVNKIKNIIRNLIVSVKTKSSIASLKRIDPKNLKVTLYFKGSNKINTFDLYDLVFDQAIISSLPQRSAATIGYYYGINYTKILHKKENLQFSFENKKNNFKYQIISIDRSKNIIFCSKQNHLRPESAKMHPFDIIGNKKLLSDFHPIQACYIGIQAGIKQTSIKKQLY